MQLASLPTGFSFFSFFSPSLEDPSACLQNVLVFFSRTVTDSLRLKSRRSQINFATLRYQHRHVFIDVPTSHGVHRHDPQSLPQARPSGLSEHGETVRYSESARLDGNLRNSTLIMVA